MKFVIKHEIKGRIRAHAVQYRMTFEQADRMQYYLESQDMITSAKVQNRTGDFTICYKGDREKVIKLLQTFRYEEVDIPENYVQNSGRELNQEYWDKLVESVIYHYGNKLFLPYSVRACITAVKSVKYLWMGVRTLAKGKLKFRYWMRPQSEYLCSAEISQLQDPSCSCLESAKYWKSGHTRNPLVTWQEACH